MPQWQRITVICPHCGHRQDEPALVVSTYCRRCRSHVEIEDGKVRVAGAAAPPAFGPPPEQRPEPPPPPPAPPPIRTRRTDLPPEEPPPPAAPAATPPPRPTAVARLRKWLRPKPPLRPVLCDQCQAEFRAPVAANATNCPRCGAYMHLRDYDLVEPFGDRIVTRGNVTVRRHAILGGPPVECHNLLVEGRLDTGAWCSGELAIRRSGLVRGKVRCASLRVERRARVEFIHPVETGTAVISGEVTGSIRASYTVTLLKRSRLRGNITATALILRPGARHVGVYRQVTADPGAGYGPHDDA